MFDWRRKKFDMFFFTIAGTAWIIKQVKHHPSDLLSKWWKTSLNKNTHIYSLGWSPSQWMPAILVFSTGFSEVILGLFIASRNTLQDEKYRELLEVKPTQPEILPEKLPKSWGVSTPVFKLGICFLGVQGPVIPTKNPCVQGSWRRQSKNVSFRS